MATEPEPILISIDTLIERWKGKDTRETIFDYCSQGLLEVVFESGGDPDDDLVFWACQEDSYGIPVVIAACKVSGFVRLGSESVGKFLSGKITECRCYLLKKPAIPSEIAGEGNDKEWYQAWQLKPGSFEHYHGIDFNPVQYPPKGDYYLRPHHLSSKRTGKASTPDRFFQQDKTLIVYETVKAFEAKEGITVQATHPDTLMARNGKKGAEVTNEPFKKLRELALEYAKTKWKEQPNTTRHDMTIYLELQLREHVRANAQEVRLPATKTITRWLKNNSHITGEPPGVAKRGRPAN